VKASIEHIKRIYRTFYRYISNSYGDTTFDIKFIENTNVRVATSVEVLRTGSWNWTYRKGRVVLRISEQHDLPLVVDEMMNLYSSFFKKIDGIEVYKAKWLINGQGTQVKIVEGYILATKKRKNKIYYHQKKEKTPSVDIKKGLRGLNRKLRPIPRITKKKVKLDCSTEEFESTNLVNNELVLCYRDSIASGNCSSGTDHFINKFRLSKQKCYLASDIFFLAPHDLSVRRLIIWKCANPKHHLKFFKKGFKISTPSLLIKERKKNTLQKVTTLQKILKFWKKAA